MDKKWMIHGGWGLAALVAFGLGSRVTQPSQNMRAGGVLGSQEPRIVGRGEDSASAARPTKSGERRSESRDSGVLGRIFGSVASADGDLDALIAQALRDPNPITRRLAFSRLLEAMTPENAEMIRAQMVSMGADGDQWRDFHYGWGAIAGQKAFDHAAGTPENDLAATLTGWAAANPSEALSLLENLPEEMQGQRDELTASVVSGLAHRDPAAAAELVLRLGGEGNERAGNLMEIVANETLRTQGPAAAAIWSATLPDGPLKGSAMNRIADAYARRDPAGAAAWARGLASEDYAAGAIERIGGRWAETDPVAAVGWLESLPAGNGQTSGLRNAFGDWEDRDPVAAGQYLMAMPQSPQRDSSISGFAMGYAWQNPQVAIEWAGSIRDPELRQSSLTRAGQAFYQRDPDGALAWLETSGLPPEARQRIINSQNRR
jgi:hypothetical protein